MSAGSNIRMASTGLVPERSSAPHPLSQSSSLSVCQTAPQTLSRNAEGDWGIHPDQPAISHLADNSVLPDDLRYSLPTSSSIAPRPFPLIPILTCIVMMLISQGCARINRTHKQACEHLASLSRELDAFLADPREDEAYHETRVKLTGGMVAAPDGASHWAGKSKAKIALPGLKDRWGVIIGGGSEGEAQISTETTTSALTDEIDTLSSASSKNYESFLRIFTKEDLPLKWDLDIGLRFNSEAEVFSRIKGRRSGIIGCMQYHFCQQFYWENLEGFGAKSRFELDQQLIDYALLREFWEVKYSENTSGLDIFAGVYLRARARDDLVISLEITNFGTTEPWQYKFFRISNRIRKNVGWQWLELEITPQATCYRRDDQWDLQPSIELLLNLSFDMRTH